MQKPIRITDVGGSRWLALMLGLVMVMAVSPSLAKTGTSAASSPTNPSSKTDEEVAKEEEPVGVFLGEYFIRDIHEAENAKTRISFSLYAAVEPESEKAFAAALTRYRGRVHDIVLTAIRLSENHDFQEPSLDRLKWRMLLRLRRGLPQLKIEHLHFRRFVFFID